MVRTTSIVAGFGSTIHFRNKNSTPEYFSRPGTDLS